jgi:Zn-dependent protease
MDQAILTIFQLVALVYSVVIHEVSHGVAAYSMGDNTAKLQGRLTLNPLKHIDMFGSVLLPLFLFLTTGFAFGYAKPVPYDPHQLNDRRWGPAKVGFAGPASNIVLALLFGIVYRTLLTTTVSPVMLDLIGGIILINLSLAFFNLMPIPPLDGHWLLFSLLPARAYALKQALYQYSLPLLIVFIIFIFPRLSFIILDLFRAITGTSLR